MDNTTSADKKSFWYRAWHLYLDGFKNLSKPSKTLWLIILIKLFIMFAILKVFFFPNVVKNQGDKEQQANFVMEQITQEINEKQ